MYYLGIDLGGTNIKAGVTDESGKLLSSVSCSTGVPRDSELICKDIVSQALNAMEQAKIDRDQIGGIGLGCPGAVDDASGMVRFAGNLGWRDFPLKAYVQQGLSFAPVRLGNDANIAAYGEYCAGSAKGSHSAVIVTLGTGVGSGVIFGSHILTGYSGIASELGHMVIKEDGRLCTCGRKGCWEAYSSATGLIAMTEEGMERDPNSVMWSISKEDGKVNGKTAFEAAKRGDETGRQVVEEYIKYLACGLANIVNIFQPEVISLAGGVSKQGDYLLGLLGKEVEKRVFGGTLFTTINICTLGSDAGLIGAAMLGKMRD